METEAGVTQPQAQGRLEREELGEAGRTLPILASHRELSPETPDEDLLAPE